MFRYKYSFSICSNPQGFIAGIKTWKLKGAPGFFRKFYIDKYPNATFWLLQEVIERERLRKEDEVVFWAKKITDEFFKIDSFSRVKQIDIVQAI